MSHASPDERSFVTTQWTLVNAAAAETPLTGRPALTRLLERYLSALHRHLLEKKRIAPETAGDILQGFVHDKLLAGKLLTQANPEKGKFRALLIKSLERYLIDQWRRRSGSLREEPAAQDEIDARDSTRQEYVDAFDVEWAEQLLTIVLERMQDECRRTGRMDLWELFNARLVLPALKGTSERSYEELQQQFGWKSPKQAADCLTSSKRMFARLLRKVIGEYETTPEAIEEEIKDLDAVLAAALRAGWQPGKAESKTSQSWNNESLLVSTNSMQTRQLFAVSEHTIDAWSVDSLREQLQQQLSTPLSQELKFHGQSSEILTALQKLTHVSPSLITFEDLLNHPQPPVPLLRAVKDFAKHCATARPSLVPKSICDFLYVSSILAALARHKQCISTKNHDSIIADARTLLDHPWLPTNGRGLVEHLLELT